MLSESGTQSWAPPPGRNLWQLLLPSSPALGALCLVTRGPAGACSALPLAAPLLPLLPTRTGPLSLPSLILLTTHSPGLPAFPSPSAQPSPTCPPARASSPPCLPNPPLNTCGLPIQTGQISSDPTWLPNYFLSETLYTQPG